MDPQRFIGMDIHRRTAETCIVNSCGQVLERHTVPCTRAGLEAFARSHLRATDQVALEATTHCWAVAATLGPFVGQALVSNPLLTRAIAQAKIKTDKVDAQVLAQLLRSDYLPAVWTPDPETQRLRTLSARRAGLVSERTRLKNRIHSVLFAELLTPPTAELFSKQGQAWLAQVELPPSSRALIESDLRLLEAVDRELNTLVGELARHAHADDRTRLLMTLPGIDYVSAVGILAALGDPDRFPDPDKLAAYLGLVPSTRQSGEKCYHGPITKHGNSNARWLLIQAAQHLRTHPGPLGVCYRKLRQKKNHNVAVVACARKMARIIWFMLKNNEPYRYAQPRLTQEKLARLRLRVTGKRKQTGPKKAAGPAPTPAPAPTPGTWHRTIPSLPEVYAQAGLPAARSPEELPAGEVRALERQGLTDYVAQLQAPRRVVRVRRLPAAPDSAAPPEAPA